jgi:hypothetical protein
VGDDPYGLSQSNIRFSLDGQERDTFSYDAGTERLSYQSGRLKYGKHTATITATDAAGNEATKTWTFKVIR